MRRAGGGIAALAALVVFFAGTAFGLVVLAGWPMPTWGTVRTAAALHAFSPHLVAQLAACVAWPCLAYLLTAVVRMGVDAWQDRPARRVGPTAWLQPVVRRAVAVLVLVSGLLNRTPAWSAPTGPASIVAAGTTYPITRTSISAVSGGPGMTSTPGATLMRADSGTHAAATGATYRVETGDALWDIAGAQLHDPLQWRSIWELNQGRAMVDRDGGHRVFNDPKLILPGWELLMPSPQSGLVPSATGPSTRSVMAPAAATSTPALAPARELPVPAAPSMARLDHPASPRPASARSSPTTDASTARRPSPPAAPVMVKLAPAPAPTATAKSTAAPVDGRLPDPRPTMVAASANHRAAPSTADIGVLVEAGLAGAAVLSILRTLRRRQAQHRPDGQRIKMPAGAAATTEHALRQNQTPNRTALVERAMPMLARAIAASTPSPAVLGALVDDEGFEVLLDRPAPAPAPWSAGAGGFRWRIPANAMATEAAPESAALPTLVSLGRVAASTADALINLEAAGLVSVKGDASQVMGSLYALASQLVAAPWAQAVNLILVAFPPGFAARDNVRYVESLGAILDELEATAQIMATTAERHGCVDLFEGRIQGEAGDGWPPAVVLCARRPSADELRLLTTIARPGGGVAAVVANAGPTRWEVDVSGSPCPVNPLHLAIEPTVLDAATMADISELLRVATDDGGASRRDPPYDKIEVSVEPLVTARIATAKVSSRVSSNGHSSPGRVDELPDLGQPAILVRVLGSVEIDGASEFKRAKSREMVVYLAMHPNGVGEAELDEALWASATGRVVIPSTRDSTVSVARTSLGGAARLLPAQGQGREKRYQLGPDVQSDWGQFCLLHRFGREHQSTTALHQALALVRGRPFEAVISGRTYGWIHTEGHGRHIEAEVADAADLAAVLYLKAADPRQARWAARQGLRAEPYGERLWVRLMEAADESGESQEIERIMDEMDAVLELEGDFGSLHPNTLATYDRLSRRHRFPTGT